MKKNIVRSVSFTLLLALCTGSLFYYACVDVVELLAMVETRNAIQNKDDSQFDKIKVSFSEFSQSDGEVWYNDHLYEIISYEAQNDGVLVTVYHNGDDEAVVKAMMSNLGYSFENANPASQTIAKYKVPHSLNWIFMETRNQGLCQAGQCLTNFFARTSKIQQNFCGKPQAPPPKILC